MAEASQDRARLLRVGDLAARTGATPRMSVLREPGAYRSRTFFVGAATVRPGRGWSSSSYQDAAGSGLPIRAINELLDCIHDSDRLEPCAVPLLVEHLHDYDAQIAELVGARDTLQGLIDSSTPREHQSV